MIHARNARWTQNRAFRAGTTCANIGDPPTGVAAVGGPLTDVTATTRVTQVYQVGSGSSFSSA